VISRTNEALRWIVAVLFVGLWCVALTGVTCGQEVNYGVIAQKPTINLPQDQGKWYVSVVGDQANQQYRQIANWFQTNRDLRKLRYQTHYNEILLGTATYEERYKPNVKGLPTVRIQDSKSRVVYEASGNNIPYSAGGLYAAIAKAVVKAKNGSWSCPRPCPRPAPDPSPPDTDPEPAPIDDGAAPDVTPPNSFDSAIQDGVVALLVCDFVISFLVGFAVSWYRQYNTMQRG